MDVELSLLEIIVIGFIIAILAGILVISIIKDQKRIEEGIRKGGINEKFLLLRKGDLDTIFTSLFKVMDDRYVRKSKIEDILRNINNKDQFGNNNETIESDNINKGVKINICDACAKEDCIFYCTTGRSKCNYFIPKSCKTCGTKKCDPKECLTATKALYWTAKQSINDIDKYDKMDYKKAIETLSGHRKHWERLLKDHICSVEEGLDTIKAFDISIDLMRLAITQLENEKSNNEVIK